VSHEKKLQHRYPMNLKGSSSTVVYQVGMGLPSDRFCIMPSFADPDLHHFGKLDPDPHQTRKLDPDPHQSET
jgi:hypothetical protein